MQNKYDSDVCGSLPVHNINLIQSYGFLMVLRKPDLRVIQVSENIDQLLGRPAQEIADTKLEAYILPEDKENLLARIESGTPDKIPVALTALTPGGTREMLAVIHVKQEYVVVELEYALDRKNSFTDVFRELKYSMAAIDRQTTLQGVCDAAVTELKKISGYDAVLMYRFDEDWNGTVIAESTVEEMSSYMGLKFPASDIPKQVRNLYLKNPYRMIPDRNFIPVKLYPVINPTTTALTDLSDCNLRSVPSVHLEYMKNMGLGASLSVRVIKDGVLWGLISCHNRSPNLLTHELRSLLELLSEIISSKVAAVVNRVQYDTISQLTDKRVRLVDYMYKENDWIRSLLNHQANLLTLFHLKGAAIVYGGKVQTLGIVPDEDELENLVFWLQAKNIQTVYAVTNLSSVNESAAKYSENGSGILVLPLNTDNGDFIIGFREEVVRDVNWGGNPDEALVFEGNGVNYHPRNSFKVWKQTVKNTSRSWSHAEIKTANDLRNNIFEYLLKQTIKDA